jgi:hypothetical protein
MTSEGVAVNVIGRILCEVWAEAEETVEHNTDARSQHHDR